VTAIRYLLVMVGLAVAILIVGSTGGLDVAVLVVILWVLPVFVGYRIHVSKERDSPLVLSLLLGWLGVLIAVTLPSAGKRCPSCDETVRSAAVRCRFCGADLRLRPRT
jgi:hypothetical protein